MFVLLSAFGILGGVIFGIAGLISHRELEQILALVCFMMAAGGFVGRMADQGKRDRRQRERLPITAGGLFMAMSVAPIIALGVGVLLLTLVPAIYIMAPVFLVWGIARGFGTEPTRVPPRPAHRPLTPSYA